MRMLIAWVPRLLAVLCLLALVPWLLGVPGIDNTYARGWTIGLWSLIIYVLFYCLIAVLGFGARRGWLALPAHWSPVAHWLAVVGFAIGQAVAWPLILSS